MSEWQPIETAPKVKKPKLLLSDGVSVWAGYWDDGWVEWNEYGSEIAIYPTHWMPLPKPPTTTEEAA